MIRNQHDREVVVAALRHAAPYIRLFKHKIFVLKAGGEVFADETAARDLLEQIALLHDVGVRVVLVHGGGPQSTRLAETLGVPARFVDGRRVTDEKTLEITTMVLNGAINTRILALCREQGLPAVGISGVDAGLVRAHRRAPVRNRDDELVDYGFVGDIERVNAAVLHTLLDDGLVPVVSPLSADSSGTVLNINADTVAAAIAAELGAEKLILAMAAPGILADRNDPGTLISYLDLAGLEDLRKKGALAAGMLPKGTAIGTAIRGGVPRVHLISWQSPDSLLLEIFTNEGTGTLVVESIDSLSPAEQSPTAAQRADA